MNHDVRVQITMTPRGVEKIRVERDRPEDGFAMLRRLLPSVRELDRASRGENRKGQGR